MFRFARVLRCSGPHWQTKRGSGVTYYNTLGVPRNASDKEIKAAYRELAKKWHPDKNPDDDTAIDKFKEVQTAYATLGNKWKKTVYDQDLHTEKHEDLNNNNSTVDDWARAAMNESPEEKDERRERYKRYAGGVRNDIPPVMGGWNNRHHFILFCFIFGGVAAICNYAPNSDLGYHRMRFFLDPAFDDKSVPLVRAYHNPVNNRWERLPEGLDPPEPDAFYKWIDDHQPELWKKVDRKRLPRIKLTCTRVPKNLTKVAYLANNLQGELVVNANSPEVMREARKKAIEAAEGKLDADIDDDAMHYKFDPDGRHHLG